MELINFEYADYFERLEMLLKQTSKRTIANYMIWRLIQYHANVMKEGFYAEKKSRDDQCFHQTREL